MSPKGDLIGIAENDGTSCEKKILLSTLSMSGYLTNQNDRGGGKGVGRSALPCYMVWFFCKSTVMYVEKSMTFNMC